MKTKKGFMLRQLGDQYVVVALGKASEEFHGIIRLNSTGAFLWQELAQSDRTEEQLAEAMLQKYDTNEQTVKVDVSDFVMKIKEAGLLEQ